MSLSFETLAFNARQLTGLSLADLAKRLNVPVEQKKGWIGLLLEKALSATAGNRPLPDFPKLGVELKTLPVDIKGRVKGSTFVCTIDLSHLAGATWERAWVYQKLKHVLWIPVESDRRAVFGSQRIGQAFFWQPSAEVIMQLRQDWEELTEVLQLGQIPSSHAGEILQVRPKAANARSLTKAYDGAGQRSVTLPRGFYLRARFTQSLLIR